MRRWLIGLLVGVGVMAVTAASAGSAQPALTKANDVMFLAGGNAGAPVARVTPSPGSGGAASNGTITILFNRPVRKVIGTTEPTFSPAVAGSWAQIGKEELVFTPSGFGFDPGTTVTVSFDRPASVVAAAATKATVAQTAPTPSYSFAVGTVSMLGLQQLLAQLQYLPLTFTPAPGVTAPTSLAGDIALMTQPLAGNFAWRWPSTPASLQAQWTAGAANVLVKGALMSFDSVRGAYNGYQMDPESVGQLADASTWQALIQAAAANQVNPNPYSYISVSKSRPETLTLWQNGAVVLTARVNTGISSRPTADGTFPIYLRYTENFMNGTNPNGSRYHDLVHWINYFNGGDAVHGFVRGSYGSPQSLGCVELPVSTSQTVFSHLAIGDLVTVSG